MRKRSALILAVMVAAAILTCDDGPVNGDLLNVVLVDEALPAGSYRTCWDQLDQNGDPAPNGGYSLWVESATGWDTSMLFFIDRSADHVPAPGCDSANVKKGVPEVYAARLNDSIYAPGDTIMIDFDLPTADSAVVRVYELAPI